MGVTEEMSRRVDRKVLKGSRYVERMSDWPKRFISRMWVERGGEGGHILGGEME